MTAEPNAIGSSGSAAARSASGGDALGLRGSSIRTSVWSASCSRVDERAERSRALDAARDRHRPAGRDVRRAADRGCGGCRRARADRRRPPPPDRIRCPRPSIGARSWPIRSAPARRRRSSPSNGRTSAHRRARDAAGYTSRRRLCVSAAISCRNTSSRNAPIVFFSSQPWHSFGDDDDDLGAVGLAQPRGQRGAERVVREVLALDVDRPFRLRRSNRETAPRTRGSAGCVSDPGIGSGDRDVDVGEIGRDVGRPEIVGRTRRTGGIRSSPSARQRSRASTPRLAAAGPVTIAWTS